MTCVIHHGPPGSFKSFGTIQRAVIPALIGKWETDDDTGEKKLVGRTVVTNIRGLDSIERIEEAMGVTVHPDSQIIFVDADNEKGFQAMRYFHHWVPFGALIAMDETQRIYSKKRHRDLKSLDLRLTDSEGNRRDPEAIKADHPLWDGDYSRAETVETAFDQHRHMNWDIYCTTPNISKVHPEIREVVEIAHRHRGLGALLPWWRNKWREFTHDPETSGKSPSHYMGSPKEYTADTRVFSCYQSTKTGKAVGTSETRYIYNDPKFQMLSLGFLAVILTFVYAGYNVYQTSPLLNGFRALDNKEVSEVSAQDGGNGNRDGSGRSPAAVALEAKFDAIGSEPGSADVSVLMPGNQSLKTTKNSLVLGVNDFLGSYYSAGYRIALAAILTKSDGSIIYRISVYDDEDLIDSITQSEVSRMGYQYAYDESGLTVYSSSESFLVRPFGAIKLPDQTERLGGSYATTQRDGEEVAL